MSSRQNLLSAVIAKLKTDSTLVTLTGHTTTSPRIGRSKPLKAGMAPYLGVAVMNETALGLSTPFFKRYVLELQVTGQSEKVAVQIADRIETLLDTRMSDSRAYWDFTTPTIRVDSARFLNRTETEFDEDLDLWMDPVRALVIANPYIGCSP